MELQRGNCALCITNTKVVVPPQASTITNVIKTVMADQINVKEFPSINSTLRVCPLCLQNILTVKALSKKHQRYISPDSENCSLCEENGHLVLLMDHTYLQSLLKGTKYEATMENGFMCLDCIKCLELMRSIRTNIVQKYPQLMRSTNKSKEKSPIKSPTIIAKRGGRKNKHNIFLSHLKPLGQTKYNFQRFRKDFTLLHKICYVKLENVDLLDLKKTYKTQVENRRNRRKSGTPRKDYKPMLSSSSDDGSPPPSQNFFKIKMKQQVTQRSTRHQEKPKHSPSVKKSPSKSKQVTPARPKRELVSKEKRPEVNQHKKRSSTPVNRQETPVKRRETLVRSRETQEESIDSPVDSKKLVVNVSRLSVDEDKDDESLVVEERDPLSISDDENVKTPTKASRKMMADTASGKKRKSVTFAEEKNVEIEYEKFEPKSPGDNTPTKKSSLKKSKGDDNSDDEMQVEYLEHVRNNVDDIFNSLKSGAPIREETSGIVTTAICSDDEEIGEKTEPSQIGSKKRKRSSGEETENFEDIEADHKDKPVKKLKTDSRDLSENMGHIEEENQDLVEPELSNEEMDASHQNQNVGQSNGEKELNNEGQEQKISENGNEHAQENAQTDENTFEDDEISQDSEKQAEPERSPSEITEADINGDSPVVTDAEDEHKVENGDSQDVAEAEEENLHDKLLEDEPEESPCRVTESGINDSQDVTEGEGENNIENNDLPEDEPEESLGRVTESDKNYTQDVTEAESENNIENDDLPEEVTESDTNDSQEAEGENNMENDVLPEDEPEQNSCEITANDIKRSEWKSDYEFKHFSGECPAKSTLGNMEEDNEDCDFKVVDSCNMSESGLDDDNNGEG